MPIVLFIIELLWFLPLFLRQGKLDAAPKKYTYFSFLTGLVFGMIIGVTATVFFSKLLSGIAPGSESKWVYKFFYNLLAAGVAEELAKFVVAFIFLKLAKPVRKLDYIFITGAAGLGFAVTENLLNSLLGNGGLINVLLPMHVMWQFYMGAHLYEAAEAKREGDKSCRTKELLLAFCVPILMHGTYDFMVDIKNACMEGYLTAETGAAGVSETFINVGMCAVLIWLAAMFAFVIVSEIRAAKLVKKSREADKAAEAV